MDRKSTAVWKGTLKEGNGHFFSQSKALDNLNYSNNLNFPQGTTGTNPEELIAAAHAGCFSMELTFLLEKAGFRSDSIEVNCIITIGKEGITDSHLDVKAKILGISKELFEKCVDNAKESCPVSKVLKANIHVIASLI